MLRRPPPLAAAGLVPLPLHPFSVREGVCCIVFFFLRPRKRFILSSTFNRGTPEEVPSSNPNSSGSVRFLLQFQLQDTGFFFLERRRSRKYVLNHKDACEPQKPWQVNNVSSFPKHFHLFFFSRGVTPPVPTQNHVTIYVVITENPRKGWGRGRGECIDNGADLSAG